MEYIMDYLVIALLAVIIILLIVLIAKQGKNNNTEIEHKLDGINEKTTEFSRSLGSEFERSRREMHSQQQSMRLETSKHLADMSEKIEKLRIDNTEHHGKTEKALSDSLNSIRLNNIEQNEILVTEILLLVKKVILKQKKVIKLWVNMDQFKLAIISLL